MFKVFCITYNAKLIIYNFFCIDDGYGFFFA